MGRRRDGTTFNQELTLTSLDDGGMVQIVRDISERRKTEDERTRLKEQFHQAQKLEAIGRLAGGIAHDFNNILAAMMGYASFLVEDLDEAAPEHEFAVQLMVAGERAKRLVQQILAFSRSEGVERETVNMIAVMDETLALLRATLPKSINVVTRVDAVSALVHANPTQMSQILMNLCVNGADAIGSAPGELTIGIDMPYLDGGCAEGLRVTQVQGGELIPARMGPGSRPGSSRMWVGVLPIGRGRRVRYVRIEVIDTGSGMPVEVMERMLEPFYTTKGIGKGTGLGLAAVHGIISAHRGAMMIESMPGEGTRFNIYLPTIEGAVSEQAQLAANAPRGCEQILIVDDEDMVSSVLAQGLERLGYEVACCISAEEALERDAGGSGSLGHGHHRPDDARHVGAGTGGALEGGVSGSSGDPVQRLQRSGDRTGAGPGSRPCAGQADRRRPSGGNRAAGSRRALNLNSSGLNSSGPSKRLRC